jgi:hypothetical protein
VSVSSELPQWLQNVRAAISSIRKKVISIRQEGQEEIHRGLEKVESADRIDRDIDYLDRVFSVDIPSKDLNDEIIMISGSYLSQGLMDADDRLSEAITIATVAGKHSQEQHGYFVRAVTDSDSSSGSAVYMGASIENRLHTLNPRTTMVFEEDPPGRIADRENMFKELEAKLAPHGDKFVSMLRGSEQSLNRDDEDALSQATHSMRDCFQQLIEHLAPTDAVKAQPWYEPVKGPPEGVSRRQRLKFILYRSGEDMDEETLSSLDKLADSAKNSLDLCIARAHNHDSQLKKKEILLSIDHARYALNRVMEVAQMHAD